MTDFNLLIEQLGFGSRTAPCGFAAGARESKLPRQPVMMIPGGGNARYLSQQPIDATPTDLVGGYTDLKVDGIRGQYIADRIVSREGTPLDCARHCLAGLKRLEQAYGYRMFFDGEYLEPGGFDATNGAFKRGEGAGVFWIFDAVPFAEWVRNDSGATLIDRRHHLDYLGQAASSEHVGILRGQLLSSYADVRALALKAWRAKLEGIVVKDPLSVYRRERGPAWKRLKQAATADCTIIDVLTSDPTKGVRVIVRGPDGPLTIWIRKDGALSQAVEGRIVEIAFNHKAGDDKPRHARFVRFREDKETSRA